MESHMKPSSFNYISISPEELIQGYQLVLATALNLSAQPEDNQVLSYYQEQLWPEMIGFGILVVGSYCLSSRFYIIPKVQERSPIIFLFTFIPN